MADGQIHRVARKFRAEMLARERWAAGEMVRRYGEMWRRIRGEIDSLTRRYYEATAAGEAASPAWLYQLNRLQGLRAQAEGELRAFGQYAETRISAEQWEAVQAAQRHMEALVLRQLRTSEEELARLGIQFNRLPREAVSDLIGFTQAGSPLRELLDALGAAASDTVQRELIAGLGLGLSPREVARRCRAAFGGNLTRALTVARTETMRAYREASHRDMEANADLVDGWIWNSGNDGRTCAMCLAMHGTVHPVTERLDDHPNGRCAPIPLTRGWAALGAKYGVDLSDLPETRVQVTPLAGEFDDPRSKVFTDAQRLNVLGKAKFEAWQRGEFDLQDVVGQVENRMWGSHRYVRSLGDTVTAASRRSRPGTFRSLGGAEDWLTAPETGLARQVAYSSSDPGWGKPFSSDAERLEKANAISREWLGLQRRFPGLKRRPVSTFYLTSREGGLVDPATLEMRIPDAMTGLEQDRALADEQRAGSIWSRARPETWQVDGLRHELGHALAAESLVWDEWVSIYMAQDTGWVSTVSRYAASRPTLGERMSEAFAECVCEITRIGYQRGTFAPDVEGFILGLLR